MQHIAFLISKYRRWLILGLVICYLHDTQKYLECSVGQKNHKIKTNGLNTLKAKNRISLFGLYAKNLRLIPCKSII